MEEPYLTTDICKIFKAERSRLQEWIMRGYIVPSIKKSKSRGEKNLFSNDDLYVIFLFARLLDKGLTRYTASKLIETLVTRGFEANLENGKRYLIWLGEQIEEFKGDDWLETDEEKSEAFGLLTAKMPQDLEGIQFALVVNLLEIKNVVDRLTSLL